MAEAKAPRPAPGGSNTHVQYNDGGDWGGDSNLTYDGSGTLTVGTKVIADEVRAAGASGLKLSDSDGDAQITVDTDEVIIDTNSVTINAESASSTPLTVESTTDLDSLVWLAEFIDNGVSIVEIRNAENLNSISIKARDTGTSAGPRFNVERNTNSTTPAAGHMAMQDKSGTYYRYWPDDSGLFRTWNLDPTNANDTSGTVVGTQSSTERVKDLDTDRPDGESALRHVVEAASNAIYSFRYKDGRLNNQIFPSGIVIDYAPRYGMDCTREFPYGNALNEITAIADLFLSVKVLTERVQKLEEIIKNGLPTDN